VVLGMPYPNPADPELRERMRFIDAVTSRADTAGLRSAAAGVNGPVCTNGAQVEKGRGHGPAAAVQTRDEPSSAGMKGAG